MATYLAPVEKPKSLLVRLVSFFARRQLGKVPTPIAVFSARMPSSFLTFYGRIGRLDKKLRVPWTTAILVREEVASLNTCAFCMDSSRWYVLRRSPEDLARLDALPEYRTSPLFSEAERAALDFAREVTLDKRVDPGTFARLSRLFSEREICDLVWLVASEHLYNLSNISLNIGSDGFCQVPVKPKARRAAR